MNSTAQNTEKISLFEKISYALGDGAANIAWRGVSVFLMIYYTDVFGLSPAAVGWLMLAVRFSDGVSDVAMGAICDRTHSKYGHFRPWVLWTAIPLAVILSLMFAGNPDWSDTTKIIYAFTTYILYTLIYTANNIPYGALMSVMTPDDKERTTLGSFRMAGAFTGGMLVQGLLLFLVTYFGNVDPNINVEKTGDQQYAITLTVPQNVEHLRMETEHSIVELYSTDLANDTYTKAKSFSAEAGKTYNFVAKGDEEITSESFRIVNQQKGYSTSIYVMSGLLALLLFLTFWGTRERVDAPKTQKTDLGADLKDLVKNFPWWILLIVALLYNIYNNGKQGITVMYFTHYLHDQLLAASYMVGLMIASIAGAIATTPLSRIMGKKNLFIAALLFSAGVNSLIYFCGEKDTTAIFALGLLSEAGAAIFPTLFFAMLGDVADYSEYVNGRRATGLVYSAGSFATKFAGGISIWIIGLVLAMYNYDGMDMASIEGARPAIVMLMSWIPAIFCVVAAVIMAFYPLTAEKSAEITKELQNRRKLEEKILG